MPLLQVDPKQCVRCGACVADCPGRLLEMGETEPVLPASNESHCIACGHCVAVCPVAALTHASMAAADCPAIDPALEVSAPQVEQLLRSRRSIRQYHEGPVDRDLLRHLIRLASTAPSGHNSQPLSWLVLSGPHEIRRLAGLVLDWMRWFEGVQPQTFRLTGMDRAIQAGARGEDRILRSAPHLVVVHAPRDSRPAATAAATALAYLELAAPSLGLGSCWAGYFTSAAATFAPLQDALGLPDGHVTYAAAMVGYPAVRYARVPLRNDPPITWRPSPSSTPGDPQRPK